MEVAVFSGAWTLDVSWAADVVGGRALFSGVSDLSSASWGAAGLVNLHGFSMLYRHEILLARRLAFVVDRLRCSSRFRELYESSLPFCLFLAADVVYCLESRGVGVASVLLDVYDLGEDGFSVLKPYVEFYVDVDDVNLLLDLWRDVVDFVEKSLGSSVVDFVDIFLTRA